MAAIGLTRYLQTLLYEVRPGDPLTYIAVIATIFAVAVASCVVPAWRASRVDPATVLRNE